MAIQSHSFALVLLVVTLLTASGDASSITHMLDRVRTDFQALHRGDSSAPKPPMMPSQASASFVESITIPNVIEYPMMGTAFYDFDLQKERVDFLALGTTGSAVVDFSSSSPVENVFLDVDGELSCLKYNLPSVIRPLMPSPTMLQSASFVGTSVLSDGQAVNAWRMEVATMSVTFFTPATGDTQWQIIAAVADNFSVSYMNWSTEGINSGTFNTPTQCSDGTIPTNEGGLSETLTNLFRQ